MATVFTVIIVLGVLILVHELGHFLLAKVFKVKVEKFSLGFGPRIWSKVVGETEYRISAVPLGGYVKLFGENPGETIEADEKVRSFIHKKWWQRGLIVAAGPFSNLIFAFFIFFITFMIFGQPTLPTTIGGVQDGLPAQVAGLKPGDRITHINGRPLKEWDELAGMVRKGGKQPLDIYVVRDGKTFRVQITPVITTHRNIFGEEVTVPVIGISASDDIIMDRMNPVEAFVAGIDRTGKIVYITYVSIIKLVQRIVPISTLGGPILIAQLAGEQAQAGVVPLLFFVALLSINLGVLNLLPIPILDGGHLLFLGIELILGRPVSLKKREIAQQVGLVILISLMAVVFYNDILRLLVKG